MYHVTSNRDEVRVPISFAATIGVHKLVSDISVLLLKLRMTVGLSESSVIAVPAMLERSRST